MRVTRPVEFLERSAEARAQGLWESRMSLLVGQRLRNDDLLAPQRPEAFREPSLRAAASPEPSFAASGGAADTGLGEMRSGWCFCANHEKHRYFRNPFTSPRFFDYPCRAGLRA